MPRTSRPPARAPAHGPPAEGPSPLAGPLASLLRPLVRLAMQSGIPFPMLAELLRGLYVEVATRELLKGPGAPTASRISLMTGVHRKEIRRQREAAVGSEAAPAAVTIASQLIARWLGLASTTDADGRPLALTLRGRSRHRPSFEALVRAITTDVRPRAVLDDLESHGLIVHEPDGRVRLDTAAFLPRPGRAEQLFYLGRNLRDHIAAAAANVTAPGEAAPFLERSVHYDQLTAEAAARLVAAGRKAAEQFLIDFNRAALAEAEASDVTAARARLTRRSRINLGLYLFHEDEPEAGEV